jgi:hypothetical protein
MHGAPPREQLHSYEGEDDYFPHGSFFLLLFAVNGWILTQRKGVVLEKAANFTYHYR